MAVVGIVPAGGSGERLGADRPKAFVVCAGRPLIEWSLEVLGSVCDRVVVAAPAGHDDDPTSCSAATRARRRFATPWPRRPRRPSPWCTTPRGRSSPASSSRSASRRWSPGVDGAIAAVPMTDTVKEAAPDGRVMRTLDRSSLWSIQTPQVFRADMPPAGARARRRSARRGHR